MAHLQVETAVILPHKIYACINYVMVVFYADWHQMTRDAPSLILGGIQFFDISHVNSQVL